MTGPTPSASHEHDPGVALGRVDRRACARATSAAGGHRRAGLRRGRAPRRGPAGRTARRRASAGPPDGHPVHRGAEPGGLVEVAGAHGVVARRGPRSSARRGAAGPCRGPTGPRAPRGATALVTEPGVQRARVPERRPAITRPFGNRPLRAAWRLARRRDPARDGRRGLGRRSGHDRRRRDPVHRDPQVDPVAQRTRDAPQVPLGHAGRAACTTGRPTRTGRTGTGSSRRRT